MTRETLFIFADFRLFSKFLFSEWNILKSTVLNYLSLLKTFEDKPLD